MHKEQIQERARKHADLVFAGPRSKKAHMLLFGERDEWGFGGRTLCGTNHRDGRWLGTGGMEEHAMADSLLLCPTCVVDALYRGWLD